MAPGPIGQKIGPFVVEAELGRGGMGEVLLARQTSLDRPAVLKKIRRDLVEREDLARRFEREARTAAQIHHPNVVAVYDQFRHRQNMYIAQEYVDGVDLKTSLSRLGGLPWRIAALIALEITRGLEEIHGLGTVHRDLKPANILIGRRGQVKIADFGLALEAAGSSLTEPGVMIGSPTYMPPEQMLGDRVDARCDLFALGVIVYEMLVGRAPYRLPGIDDEEADEPPATGSLLKQMQSESYPKPKGAHGWIPRPLVKLLRRLMRGKAARRPATTREVRLALERGLGGPSAADARDEILAYVVGRGLFEPEENETVWLDRPLGERSARRAGWAWAAAGVLAVAALAATFIVAARPATEWSLGAGSPAGIQALTEPRSGAGDGGREAPLAPAP